MSRNINEDASYCGVCMEVAGAESMPITGVGPMVIPKKSKRDQDDEDDE